MLHTSDDPAEALAELREAAKSPVTDPLPSMLRGDAIKQKPEVFQPRGQTLDEHHVQVLARAIRNQGPLDPVLVIQIGGSAYLIDGHHRLEAYGVAGFGEPVPVEYFKGSLDEAILEAGRTNSKAKLAMTHLDRQNFAWRLVRLGTYTKKQEREAASVSDGQIATMRRVRKLLGDEASRYPDWWRALNASHGYKDADWTDDDREAWKRERANALAEKLSKAWGPKPIQQWEVAALALEQYFGRRLSDLVGALRGLVPDEPDEDGSDAF
jgi:ParB-like chromosome segregation protein Spo0J